MCEKFRMEEAGLRNTRVRALIKSGIGLGGVV